MRTEDLNLVNDPRTEDIANAMGADPASVVEAAERLADEIGETVDEVLDEAEGALIALESADDDNEG